MKAMNAFAIEEGLILTNDEERELTFEYKNPSHAGL